MEYSISSENGWTMVTHNNTDKEHYDELQKQATSMILFTQISKTCNTK